MINQFQYTLYMNGDVDKYIISQGHTSHAHIEYTGVKRVVQYLSELGLFLVNLIDLGLLSASAVSRCSSAGLGQSRA